MTYSLSNNCTKNYYNRTFTVQVIVEDVVTWIFLKHSVDLLLYCRTHKLISKQHHGFLSKRSTVTNMLSCLNDWTCALTNRQSVAVAYIAFQKAFDSVCHSKVFSKLSSLGIAGNLLKWLREFLSNRWQRTRVGNSLSGFVAITSGVIQEVVLAHCCFYFFYFLTV